METLLQSRSTTHKCPTCGNEQAELAPGIYDWEPSTYRYGETDVPCDCEDQIALFRHYVLARIPEEYMRLDETDYYGDAQALADTIVYLENWDGYKQHGMGCNFHSKKQGTGKTFLATLIGRELIKQREKVFFINFFDMVSTYQMPYEDRKQAIERLRNVTVLILDEVGKSVSSAQRDFIEGEFEALIRYRSNYTRVTIITSNIEPDELDKEYPRVYSLLSAKQKTMKVNGGDARRVGILDKNEELALNGETRSIK